MATELELADYAEEIRRQVCRHCFKARPCNLCGVELHLRELVDAIHETGAGRLGPYAEHTWPEVCAVCAFRDCSICPCPMEAMTAPLLAAVTAVDERREQGRHLRRRVCGPTRCCRAPIDEMCRAYEEATGVCIGCD